MARYHIKKDGTPGICHAQPGKCPLGGMSQHYASQEEAQQAADNINSQNLFNSEKNYSHEDKLKNTKTKLNALTERNNKIPDNSEHILGGRTSDNFARDMTYYGSDPEERMPKFILGSDTTSKMLGEGKTPVEQLHNGIEQISNVKLTDNLSDSNVRDLSFQGWVFATKNNIKAFAAIGGLVSEDNYDDKTLSEMSNIEISKDKQGSLSSDQYTSAYREITNSAYKGRATDFSGLANADRNLSNDYVTVGELRSKINSDSQSDNDRHSTLGAYSFAHRYAMETENLNEEQIQEISKKEGLVKHVEKSVGARKKDINIINLSQAVLAKRLNINPKDYGSKAVIKGTKHKALSEYALNTPIDKYDKEKVEKAYKYLGQDSTPSGDSIHTSIQGVRDILK